MFSNTVTLALDTLSPLCGDSRVSTGAYTGQEQPLAVPASTHGFLRGTVPATVRLALLGHIPHPARQENSGPMLLLASPHPLPSAPTPLWTALCLPDDFQHRCSSGCLSSS